jgi:1-phosphofructokinase family hexose kinase
VILAVALSPSLDRTLVVDEIAVGRIHRPDVVVGDAGGKGFNVARALHLMSVPVIATGVLGGPTGGVVEALLAGSGVTADLVRGASQTRTCTSVACRSGRHLTEFYEPAPAISAEEWQEVLRVVGRSAGPGDWVTLSGTVPGAPAGDDTAGDDAAGDVVRSLIESAHERGALVAVDTHGVTLRHAVSARPDLVKVNQAEAAELVAGCPEPGEAMEPALLAELLAALLGPSSSSGPAGPARRPGRAVVTAGTRGAWAHDGALHHVRSAVEGQFPVGSGDCFLAGLVAGLHEGLPLPLALVRGTAMATANALEPGAARFDPRSVPGIEAGVELTSG